MIELCHKMVGLPVDQRSYFENVMTSVVLGRTEDAIYKVPLNTLPVIIESNLDWPFFNEDYLKRF